MLPTELTLFEVAMTPAGSSVTGPAWSAVCEERAGRMSSSTPTPTCPPETVEFYRQLMVKFGVGAKGNGANLASAGSGFRWDR